MQTSQLVERIYHSSRQTAAPFADVTYERADKGVTFHGLRDVTVTATGDNTMNVTVEQGNSWDFDLPRGSTHNTMNIDYAVRLTLAWARTGLESVNQRFRMPRAHRRNLSPLEQGARVHPRARHIPPSSRTAHTGGR